MNDSKINIMNRRKFLTHSGMLITVPVFLNTFGPFLRPLINSTEESDVSNKLNIPILRMIGIGITAPNPHNSQAWKFKILNDYECSLYVDEKRVLPETDPASRQIHIGQGTFLETLSIGAAGTGYDVEISYFPEGFYNPDEMGEKPVAHVKLTKSKTDNSDPLFDSLPMRQTTRTVYSGDNITDREFNKIHDLVNPDELELGFINDTDKIKQLIPILIKAMTIETNVYRIYDETKNWFRFSDEEISETRDGLSLAGNGMSGIFRWLAEKFFLSPDSWHSESNKTSGLNSFQKMVRSSRGFVYIKTAANNPLDWVKSGHAYCRLNLAATKIGLALHPMSQVLQEFREMKSTQKTFNSLLDVKKPMKIQMMARLGRSDYRYFQPRRSVRSMLIK